MPVRAATWLESVAQRVSRGVARVLSEACISTTPRLLPVSEVREVRRRYRAERSGKAREITVRFVFRVESGLERKPVASVAQADPLVEASSL